MNELELLNKEYDDTQEALADLARVVGIDPERWDNDDCPNNSDMVKEIIAEIQNPWQPIECAPKDGSYILVSGLHHGNSIRWYENACWEESLDGWWNHFVMYAGADCLGNVTHWMALPNPPTGTEL